MNSSSTRNWIIVAAALFAFIFFFERHLVKPLAEPLKILSGFKAAAVTSVQVDTAGQLPIRTVRSNGVWRLTRPISYPAQATGVETLLAVLEQLSPATYISARELRQRSKFDEEYGFDAPQVTLGIQRGDENAQILIGKKTAPGDQVFLQVVGVEGVYVVDAELLKLIPHSVDDWRDTAMIDLTSTLFDRLLVTSGGNTIEFQINPTNKLWTMTRPLQARADNGYIVNLLQRLQALRVIRFVTDNPKADLDVFGLQPPVIELAFANGTNKAALLQFGKVSTNDAAQIFARRDDLNSIVTVSKDLIAPWRAGVDEFRDHRVLSDTPPINQIEIRGENSFTLQFNGSNSWKVASENFLVDTGFVNDFISALATMHIVQFKDAVTEPDLPDYGLAAPSTEIILRSARSSGETATNDDVHISFGKSQDDVIFVRRSDENSVYAVKVGEFQQLPTAAWQLRDRRIWNFTENEVARLVISQNGAKRELIRNGTNSWSFAAGSQGDINVFGVEETVHRLGELAATAWISRGDENRGKFGITNGFSLMIELKNGEKPAVEFGNVSETHYPYAATTLGGQTWIFQLPIGLYQYVLSYLAVPVHGP